MLLTIFPWALEPCRIYVKFPSASTALSTTPDNLKHLPITKLIVSARQMITFAIGLTVDVRNPVVSFLSLSLSLIISISPDPGQLCGFVHEASY